MSQHRFESFLQFASRRLWALSPKFDEAVINATMVNQLTIRSENGSRRHCFSLGQSDQGVMRI
jgi:hypothetical protein